MRKFLQGAVVCLLGRFYKYRAEFGTKAILERAKSGKRRKWEINSKSYEKNSVIAVLSVRKRDRRAGAIFCE